MISIWPKMNLNINIWYLCCMSLDLLCMIWAYPLHFHASITVYCLIQWHLTTQWDVRKWRNDIHIFIAVTRVNVLKNPFWLWYIHYMVFTWESDHKSININFMTPMGTYSRNSSNRARMDPCKMIGLTDFRFIRYDLSRNDRGWGL